MSDHRTGVFSFAVNAFAEIIINLQGLESRDLSTKTEGIEED